MRFGTSGPECFSCCSAAELLVQAQFIGFCPPCMCVLNCFRHWCHFPPCFLANCFLTINRNVFVAHTLQTGPESRRPTADGVQTRQKNDNSAQHGEKVRCRFFPWMRGAWRPRKGSAKTEKVTTKYKSQKEATQPHLQLSRQNSQTLASAYEDWWLETSCRCNAQQRMRQKKGIHHAPWRERTKVTVCHFLLPLLTAAGADESRSCESYGKPLRFPYVELSNPIKHQPVGFVDSKTFRKLLQSTQPKDRLIIVFLLYNPLNPHSSQLLNKRTLTVIMPQKYIYIYILFPCKHIS